MAKWPGKNPPHAGEETEEDELEWWDYLLVPFEGVANIFGRSLYSPEEQETGFVKGVQQWHPVSGLWGGMESSFEALGALTSAPIRQREDWTTAIKPWEYLPGGAEIESYEKLPWWQQLIYESPVLLAGGWGATGALPKAGETLMPTKGLFGLKTPPPQAIKPRRIPAKKGIGVTGATREPTEDVLRLAEERIAKENSFVKILEDAVVTYEKGELNPEFWRLFTLKMQRNWDKSMKPWLRRHPELETLEVYTEDLIWERVFADVEGIVKYARGLRQPTAVDLPRFRAFIENQFQSQRAIDLIREGTLQARVQTTLAKVATELTNPTLAKLSDLMQTHKVARKATKAARKVTLKERVAKAQSIYDDILEKTGDAELARRTSMRELRGKLPTAKAEALSEAVTAEEIAQLQLKVAEQPTFNYFEKIRAQGALGKFLNTEEILQPAELKLLEKIFPGFTELNTLKYRMGNKIWRNFVDAANIPRALLASTDLSVTLRQGVMLLTRFPGEMRGMMNWQLKTLFSQKNWQALDDVIRSDPDFGIFDEVMKIYLAPEPGALARLSAREEYYMSRLAEKMPWVKISERAFTSGGNYLRYKTAQNYLNIARKAGMTDEATLRGLGRLINAASGRGDLPRWMSGGAPMVNALLFAPRFVASRLQVPWLIISPSSTALVRKEATRLFVQFLGAGTSVLSLAALGGAKVELDPRSSDFGKIRVGDTRLDIWAGYIQWARFLGQVTTAQTKIVGTDRIADKKRIDTVWNLIQSKASPVASIFTDLLKGETYIGEPMFEGGWETFAREMRNRLCPLFAQDLWDAIETDGLGGGLVAAPGLLGVGIVSYEPRGGNVPPGFPTLPKYKLPELELPKIP